MINYYNELNKERQDSQELQDTIKETTSQLFKVKTTSDHPGVLLGKIQSGKTRAFIGIMATAFDEGIDVVVVLTKNSQLLGEQTTRRINNEFEKQIKGGFIDVYYVNNFNDTVLKKAQMLNKKVFVAIKNPTNIEKLIAIFDTHNPALREKKILIIDDEADYGSVGFRYDKKTDSTIVLTTAQKLSELRNILPFGYFLQVTATPYSLYLQPESIELDGERYQPVRPAFTTIMKDHPGYTGGKFYFEDYIDPSSPASYLHITATDTDVQTLASKKQDQRIIDNVDKTDKLPIFRKAIINFLIAVATRRTQYIKKNNIDPGKATVNLLPRFGFIFHINTAKSKMAWQANLINEYLNKLIELKENNEPEFKELFQDNYENDIKQSLHLGANKGWVSSIPGFNDVYYQLTQIFEYEDYNTYLINSDERVINYANENGQLRLETGLNFFVGGQVLDRGITIDNLIGFFYGRSPQKSQMDTVLQHARMYGNRNKEDLCVTRFYTSNIIFQRMREIHQIDEALRQALLKNNDHEIVCIQRANNGNIMPTNPNRLMLSNVITLKTRKTFYPYGFETIGYTGLNKTVEQIEKKYLHKVSGFTTEKKKTFKISKSTIFEILQLADKQFLNYEEGVPLNIEQWQTILERLLSDLQSDDLHCYVQTGRRISRYQKNGEPSDSPYTTSTDIVVARNKIAEENLPLIMLLKQEGRVEDGWKGAPFYWPVLVLPELERPLLFEWSV